MKGTPKISVEKRFEAFRYYFPIPEKELIKMIKGREFILEQMIIDARWPANKKLSKEETIYKEWCNGKSYVQIVQSMGENNYIVRNAIGNTRAKLIEDILKDAQAGLISPPAIHTPEGKETYTNRPITKAHANKPTTTAQVLKKWEELKKEVREAKAI